MSTGFWGFQVVKIVVFKKILLKIFKNKKKKIVDFWKKTILFLNSRYHFAFDKKFSKRNFIENKIQFIQRLTVFFDSESRLKERKIFLNYFFTVFIKNFFYGNTFRSVRYFSYLGSFVRTVTYWNKKFYFYFFYICCSRFLFLIKTNIRSFISNNPDTWVFVFYPIANFPTFFYFKEVNWLKIIGFLSKKKILSNNSKKQLIGLNIIKKFIISKIFPFDFMNCILASLFIFLKTTIYDNRFSANFILVHYFSCIKPNYKKFKIGLLLFIRCLYTKRINSKLIFFEIFLNLSSNSSKKFLNIFSKIIFPKLFFNFFLDFEKICTFFLGLVLKIFYLKLNAENFFYQIFKIQQIKKKKSKWFLIRIDMLWKKIFFFSTQKHASFLIDGISRFIVDFPNIYCFFSKKEWDIVYFFTLLCNYLLNQNSWIILTPLFYQLPWHKFFKQIFSDFFWIKKKKNKFIKFFFFKLSDSNILAFNRFSKKFFSFIFYFIKYMVVYSLNSTKNERKILYELIILKNFYPSLEKKISSFPQKSLNQKMLFGFEDKIFYFYDIMKHLKSSLKRSFYLSIYFHYSTKNLSDLFLYKSLFENFSTKQYKKEFFFLGKIIKTFNKYF